MLLLRRLPAAKTAPDLFMLPAAAAAELRSMLRPGSRKAASLRASVAALPADDAQGRRAMASGLADDTTLVARPQHRASVCGLRQHGSSARLAVPVQQVRDDSERMKMRCNPSDEGLNVNEPNTNDVMNPTPVFIASRRGNAEVVEMLLQAGADVSITN
eukprot:COSAG01_NODE_1088_length_11788_cov_12.741124_13_plen_159_part_00